MFRQIKNQLHNMAAGDQLVLFYIKQNKWVNSHNNCTITNACKTL